MTPTKPPREEAAEAYAKTEAYPGKQPSQREIAEYNAHLAGQRHKAREILEWLIERQHLIPSRVMEEIKQEFGEE